MSETSEQGAAMDTKAAGDLIAELQRETDRLIEERDKWKAIAEHQSAVLRKVGALVASEPDVCTDEKGRGEAWCRWKKGDCPHGVGKCFDGCRYLAHEKEGAG